MEFVLLIHGDEAAFAALSEEETKKIYAAHGEFMAALKEAGVASPYSAEIAGPATGKVVRPDGDERLVIDGPFAESKEQLGGFYVVDVPTEEEAVAWARRIPLIASDAVEVRKVL